MGSLWILIDIVAPLLLIGVIVWAVLRNGKASRGEIERSERGAKELREELNREDTREGGS